MKIKGSFIFIFLFISSNAFSQALFDIITDRPDVTESSFTIPKNFIQIETGFSYTKNIFDNEIFYEDELMETPLTNGFLVTPVVLLRYGLTDKIELRAGAQVLTESSKNENPQTIDITKTNIEGVDFGLKFKLAKQNSILPSIAIIAGSSIPIIGSSLTTDLFDPSVTFCFSNIFSDKAGIGYNLGFNLDDGINSSASGVYSVSLNYSLFESVGIFGEAYGFIPFTNVNTSNFVDGGFTFLLSQNMQLDLSGGYGLNSNTEFFLSTGFSIRLPK